MHVFPRGSTTDATSGRHGNTRGRTVSGWRHVRLQLTLTPSYISGTATITTTVEESYGVFSTITSYRGRLRGKWGSIPPPLGEAINTGTLAETFYYGPRAVEVTSIDERRSLHIYQNPLTSDTSGSAATSEDIYIESAKPAFGYYLTSHIGTDNAALPFFAFPAFDTSD